MNKSFHNVPARIAIEKGVHILGLIVAQIDYLWQRKLWEKNMDWYNILFWSTLLLCQRYF